MFWGGYEWRVNFRKRWLWVNVEALNISHLLFVDDTIISMELNWKMLKPWCIFCYVLRWLWWRVNFRKSEISSNRGNMERLVFVVLSWLKSQFPFVLLAYNVAFIFLVGFIFKLLLVVSNCMEVINGGYIEHLNSDLCDVCSRLAIGSV